MVWTTIDISTNSARSDARAICAAVRTTAGLTHVRHDLDWAIAENGAEAVSLLAETTDGSPSGFAVLHKKSRPLPLQFGEVTFYRRPLIRHELWAEPVLAASGGDAERIDVSLRSFLETVIGVLGRGEALSIEGLRIGEPFHRLITEDPAIRAALLPLPIGAPFLHQFILMPPTLDAYLGQMSKRSRKSVQYSQRKIVKDFDEDVETRRFATVESVERFLDDAVEISKKTYQWRLLGLGIRDREQMREFLTFGAEREALRCYILYCKSTPVAFMIGYQYADTYYYIDVGYDPDWATWSVGSVLQLNVIEDLYAGDDTPNRFDFSTGYGEHKARFGNFEQEEVNMLLLPNVAANRLLARAHRLSVTGADGVIAALDKVGLKKPLKRLVRRFGR